MINNSYITLVGFSILAGVGEETTPSDIMVWPKGKRWNVLTLCMVELGGWGGECLHVAYILCDPEVLHQ